MKITDEIDGGEVWVIVSEHSGIPHVTDEGMSEKEVKDAICARIGADWEYVRDLGFVVGKAQRTYSITAILKESP